jgi:thiamine-phosphate pyrophosphorylase
LDNKNLYRIIDANVNRVAEGLRVLEDVERFYFNNYEFSNRLRLLRHNCRENIKSIYKLCLNNRDSINDIGLKISKNTKIDNKTSLFELVEANFKRAQEALRVLEELLKVIYLYEVSKKYEIMRFELYSLEKDIIQSLNFKYRVNKKEEKLKTDLYCITSHEHSLGRDNINVVKEMLEENIKLIQYREKEKSKLEKLKECREIRKITSNYNATFIVNDDIDIAKIVNADGVHIGQDDLPVKEARSILGEDFIIGVSTHSKEQCQKAIKDGADYIGVGPIFKTNTKKDVCSPVGLEYLKYVTENVDIPFVAIGGIKEHNIGSVLKEKPYMVALVTEIVGAKDIKKKIRNLRSLLND